MIHCRTKHWEASDALLKETYGDWTTYLPEVKDTYNPATIKHKGQPLQTVHHYKLKEGQ